MMSKTGAVAPRLGVKEYWLGNEPNVHSPTFTGSEGEHEFRKQVHLVSRVTQRMTDLLRPIAIGEAKIEECGAMLTKTIEMAREMVMGMLRLIKAFDRGGAEFSVGMR